MRYLIRDPARPPDFGVYPLKNLTSRIEALRYYTVVPPPAPLVLPTLLTAPSLKPLPGNPEAAGPPAPVALDVRPIGSPSQPVTR
jgi:hypothetical protein